MGYDLLTILELCGLAGLAFLFTGVLMLAMATTKARREYRTKGFLRPPSGTAWFRFFFWRQYEYFENPRTRFLFGTAHFCMLGAIIVLAGVAALVGSEVLFNGVGALTLSTSSGGLPIIDADK